MLKTEAIELLGASVTSAAKRVGVTTSAVCQWPEVLTKTLEDRVIAAYFRREFPKHAKAIYDRLR